MACPWQVQAKYRYGRRSTRSAAAARTKLFLSLSLLCWAQCSSQASIASWLQRCLTKARIQLKKTSSRTSVLYAPLQPPSPLLSRGLWLPLENGKLENWKIFQMCLFTTMANSWPRLMRCFHHALLQYTPLLHYLLGLLTCLWILNIPKVKF